MLLPVVLTGFCASRPTKGVDFLKNTLHRGEGCFLSVTVRVHQGRTPAEQAQGDSELAAYLSKPQRTQPAPREDLETAV